MSVQSPGLQAISRAAQSTNRMDSTLRAAGRRIRTLLMLRYTGVTLCASASICLLAVGLSKLRLFVTPQPWLLAAAIGIAVLAGVLWALLRPLTDLDVAKLTERRADLKERFSSAVEFRKQGVDTSEPFYGEQLADADHHAGAVNLSALYPLRLTRTFWFGLLACLTLFLVYFLPTLPAFWSKERRQEVEDVKKQGIAILKLVKDTQKTADQQKLDETKKAAAEARKLGEAMEKAKISKKEALISLQKLTKKMEETQKRMAASLPAKPMEQAHREFKRSLEQMQQEAQQNQMKNAGKKMAQNQQGKADKKPGDKNAQKPPEESPAMKQARQALQQMAQAMAEMNNQQMQQSMNQIAQQMQSGQMSKEEMKQLQQALQQLSKALQNSSMNQSGQQLAQLSQMMENMSNMDPNTLQQMAAMCRGIGKGMGKGNGMPTQMMDMKMLQQLMEALKQGRLTMAMGNGKFGFPGGMGKGPYGGHGVLSKAMKEPAKTKPKLEAMGTSAQSKATGKNGDAKEFAKYLAMKAKGSSKYLPNGKIAGTRSQNGNELQLPMSGDPDPVHGNGAYYTGVYETSKRQAESALNKENIPAAYKEQVRKYFDSIRPNR